MSGAMAARWFSVLDLYPTSPKVVGSSPALFVQVIFALFSYLNALTFDNTDTIVAK
jgi:hypothetical protein